jgi:hypothetical protein
MAALSMRQRTSVFSQRIAAAAARGKFRMPRLRCCGLIPITQQGVQSDSPNVAGVGDLDS